MAMKTGSWGLALLLLAPSPLASQGSPLQWPIPKAPSRELVSPRILIGAGELAGLLKAGRAVPMDVHAPSQPASYELGHPPGAVPAWSLDDETAVDPDRIRSLLAERGIAGDKAVVLYGDGDHETVARLFWLLRWAGCAEVRILDGGLAAWRAAGGALETGPSRRPATEFRPPRRDAAVVDAGWLADSFGLAGTEVLDVRDARGWERWETPPTFAAGHIPYSLPFDPRTLLPEGAGWPDPAEVRRRLGTLGPRPGDPVSLESTFVLYGQDARDPRLGLGYLLLALAGIDARVFPGGWQEWTAEGSRPVVRVISAAELAARLEREKARLSQGLPPHGLILLDLREARDFAIGHLPGALGLPFHRFTETFAQTVEAGWPDADRANIPLVLYCYGPDCVRSRKAGAEAAHLGFRNVLWFRGGIQEWRDAAYPLLDSPLPTAVAKPKPAAPGGGAARP
jgi:thiosulfate/3-mercaptopyruvate sulfurtransferase